MPDPRPRALAFVDKYEPKRKMHKRSQPKGKGSATSDPKDGKEESAKALPSPKAGGEPACSDSGKASQALVRQAPQELLPPQPQAVTPSLQNIPLLAPVDITPRLDAIVKGFECLFEAALDAFDLNQPEGFIDTYIWGRPDHRMDSKIERSDRLVRLFENFQQMVDLAAGAEGKIRALNRARQEEYVQQFRVIGAAMEEWQTWQYVPAAAARRNALAEAKVKADIAAYAAMAEKARLSALPPPPPPPMTPPVDEATRKREEARHARREEIDMHLDEQEERAGAAEESVARAIKRCSAIYQDLIMRDGEKRARIQRLLDEYNLDWSILPIAVEELMENGYTEVEP